MAFLGPGWRFEAKQVIATNAVTAAFLAYAEAAEKAQKHLIEGAEKGLAKCDKVRE